MYNQPFDITIKSQGFAVGNQCLSNKDLIQRFDIKIKPSFIDNNIGIDTRYFVDEDTATSDLAAQAAQQALTNANLTIHQIDRLIVATSTGDYLSPSTACVVQHKLGGSLFPAYDVGAACSGFIYALDQAIRSVATSDENVLVVGVDVRSRTLDVKNKRTVFLYGDGAGAVIVSRIPRHKNEPNNGFLASFLTADGAGHDAVVVPSVGVPSVGVPSVGVPSVGASQCSAVPVKQGQLIMPNGQRVSENANRGIPFLCERVLNKAGCQMEAVDMFVFHQPNYYLLSAVKEQLGIPAEKIVINFPTYGNTVAGSVPIALCQAVAEKKLKPNYLVLLCAVGAGFTGGAHLLRWTQTNAFD